MRLLESASTPSIIACGSLLAAVISLWLRPRYLWLAVLGAAIVAAYVAGVLQGLAAGWIVLLAAALLIYWVDSSRWTRWLCLTAVVAITLLLGIHALPGFHNPLIVKEAIVASGATPYTLHFNFDKTMAGIVIIGMTGLLRPQSQAPIGASLRDSLPLVAVGIGLVMAMSLALGYVRFEPRWHPLFWVWATVNLMLTCVSEEAFFRGFLQRELCDALGTRRHAAVLAVGAGAVLFGIAHFAGGAAYVVLATIAGACYGLVYQRTRRIELAILAHFTFNAVHFLLFTYPRVA